MSKIIDKIKCLLSDHERGALRREDNGKTDGSFTLSARCNHCKALLFSYYDVTGHIGCEDHEHL